MTRKGPEYAIGSAAIEALLFDLDGTLIDSAEDLLVSVDHAFKAAGVEPPGRDQSRALLGAPLEEMPSELGTPLSSEQMEAFLAAFRAHYPLHWLENTALYPGARELLEALSGRFRIALVTTKRQEQAVNICGQLSIARFFDHIQGFVAGLRHKPAPDILLAALRELGVEPARAVMIGDTHRDMLAGRAAGCRTIAVAWGCGSAEALSRCSPDAVADSIIGLQRMLLGGIPGK